MPPEIAIGKVKLCMTALLATGGAISVIVTMGEELLTLTVIHGSTFLQFKASLIE